MTTGRAFQFHVSARDGAARAGLIETPHGAIRTPAFMPVGTAATVKGLLPSQVRATGADILLGNTYHLMLRPGAERIARLGGLHRFMHWPHAILTDSGGFQVMSLDGLRTLSERGVVFQSHLDGSRHELTPERAVELQLLLGSDIQMQLDECLRLPAERSEVARAMGLSLRWAERARRHFEHLDGPQRGHALYGIVQGGDCPDLRIESARELSAMPFEGLAVGGLAVGEPQAVMLAMLETVVPHLPAEKPRYLMGVGTPDDLLKAIALGIDQFDCVMPTRTGRHGQVFTRAGRINLRNARHADDSRPLAPDLPCFGAREVSRAYLHHLIRSEEMLGAILLTEINLTYYQVLMAEARAAIAAGRYAEFQAETQAGWARGDLEAGAAPSLPM